MSFLFPYSEQPLPVHFNSAKMRDYEENINPEEHLARFENISMLHYYDGKIKCKAFLTMLVDSSIAGLRSSTFRASKLSKTSEMSSYTISVVSRGIKRLCSIYLKSYKPRMSHYDPTSAGSTKLPLKYLHVLLR